MPHALDWTTINDFTPGLIELDDWFVPAQGQKMGAQQMDDCYPSPVGGLRAWAKFGTTDNTGFESDQYPIGMYVRSGIPVRSGTATEASDFYMAVWDTGTDQIKLYRRDETNDDGSGPHSASQWDLIKTFTTATGRVGPAYFVAYTLSGGTTHVYVSIDGAAGDDGLWRIQYSDGVLTQITTHSDIRGLTTHQDRIFYATSEQDGSRVRWNDTGTETFATDNFLDVFPFYQLTDTVWMRPLAQDLLIAKHGAPFTLVQGDIESSPAVRRQGAVHFGRATQQPVETPEGLIYQAYQEGVYATRTGNEIKNMSKALKPGVTDGVRVGDSSIGSPQYVEPWVLLPSGFILDVRTGAWFKTTTWSNNTAPVKHQIIDHHVDEGLWYGPSQEQGFTIHQLDTRENHMGRAETFTWKSAPLHDPTGRMLMLREVEVYAKSNGAGASIVCTVNGTTRTVSSIDSGKQKIKFRFREASEVLDVQLTSNSNSGGTEAPSIETVRIGTTPWHRSR